MNCRLALIFSVFICNQFFGQTYKEQFYELFSKKDTAGQRIILNDWNKSDSKDSELFVAYFNYYVNISKKEVLSLGNKPKGEEYLQIVNQDTTVSNPVGYMYADNYYELTELNKGFDWINKGIEMYPNRLDMRFGKIYMLGKIENYEDFTKEIIRTVNYSNTNKNKWTWTDNKPVEKPESFLLNSLQNYQLQLYDTEDDRLLDNMKLIAETILKFYPNNIESITNLSFVYMLQEKYEKAIEQLLLALKINSKDPIVLNNIAHSYKQSGDKPNAIKYYELMIKYGNDSDKKYAQKQIDLLK